MAMGVEVEKNKVGKETIVSLEIALSMHLDMLMKIDGRANNIHF